MAWQKFERGELMRGMDNGHFLPLKMTGINIKNEWIIGLKKWKGRRQERPGQKHKHFYW